MRADVVDRYLRDFERWAGTARLRRELRAELEEHLREAEEAGRLDEALDRLGSPKEAARNFIAGRVPRHAPRWRRLLGVGVDIAVMMLLGTVGVVWAGSGPGRGTRILVEYVLFLPQVECLPGPCDSVQAWALISFMTAALFWFVVVVTLLEWRYGRSLGKRVARTRVVSEDGTAITLSQAVIRRLPFVFLGLLQIVDWAFALFGPTYQRGFDRIARTIVVEDRVTSRD